MKPARFDYHDPVELPAALGLLGTYGDEAKVLAGGQSLVPMLNMRLAQPAVVVDINRIEELSYIREENGALAVGALTRQRMLERSDAVRRRCPLLTRATEWIGHVQTRNRGTVGGSLVHHDPSAELVTVAALLGAEMVVESSAGRRVIAAPDFFVGHLTTSLLPGELLTGVRFPCLAPGTGWAFGEIARREGDFALASAAAALRINESGQVTLVRLVLGGVGSTPVHARAAEAALVGELASPEAFAAAGELASRDLDPPGDIHGSSAFRKHLAGVVAGRTLSEASTRAMGGTAA